MKKTGRLLLAAALLVFAASAAWGAVSISWVDALGLNTQYLVNVPNPAYNPSDPLNSEAEYIWIGVINVAMSLSPNPIQFNVSGTFIGELGLLWDQVRIEQHVTNLTPYPWSEFYIDIVNEDGEIYTKAMLEQNWSFSNTLQQVRFYADAPQYYIQPGQVFDDTMVYYAMISNPQTGEGSLTFTKRPTMIIPEAGGLAVLLTGGAGLASHLLRKRRA